MFPSSNTNKELLRELIQQSLQECLIDCPADEEWRTELANADSQDQTSCLRNQRISSESILSTANTVSGRKMSPLAMCTSFPRIPGPLIKNFPQEELNHIMPRRDGGALLATSLLASDLLRRQIMEDERKRLLQESYAAMWRHEPTSSGKISSLGSQSLALQSLLAANRSTSTLPSLTPRTMSSNKNSFLDFQGNPQSRSPSNALQALGSSLRKKDDPYIDASILADPDPTDINLRRTRGGVSTPFPEKLHQMLMDVEKEGNADIVSFFSHGRAFCVHDMDQFVSDIMPRYFKQSKWNSFARQLNLYGFIRISHGPDAGGYYHELFLKGRPNLCFHMRRVGVPQGEDRRKLKTKHDASDPDFYSMKPITGIASSK